MSNLLPSKVSLFALLLPLLLWTHSAFSGDSTKEELQILVKQLGDEEFTKRSDAEKKLKALGEKARSALNGAANSDEAELKLRANRLLGILKTEPLLKKMEAAVFKKESMTLDMDMVMSMMGQKTNLAAKLKMHKDGKRFVMDSKVSVMGQEIPSHAISDGETFWNEIELPGGRGKMIQKWSLSTLEKLGGGASSNPLDQVKQLRERFDFTDVQEGSIDGEDVHILAGKIREGVLDQQTKVARDLGGEIAAQAAAAELAKMDTAKVYIHKKSLWVNKTEVLDKGGDVVTSIHLKNIKQGIELDDKLFSYTPPEGATVMDMEEQLKNAREMGGGQGVPPAPKPKPKNEEQGGF